jgi:hypothetical protein
MTTVDERETTGQPGNVSRTAGVPVTAHTSAPGRTVFVEDGNSDAWMASDLTVTPDR